MSVNPYRPHLLVLPEDDANRQLAVGFQLRVSDLRQMQILPVANGWMKVLDEFESVHVDEMRRTPQRTMVLLIDFDADPNRSEFVRAQIPQDLSERVFVLGVWTEPEDLTESFGTVGRKLAEDCRDGTSATWDKPLFKHNAAEVDRLRKIVRPFLFA